MLKLYNLYSSVYHYCQLLDNLKVLFVNAYWLCLPLKKRRPRSLFTSVLFVVLCWLFVSLHQCLSVHVSVIGMLCGLVDALICLVFKVSYGDAGKRHCYCEGAGKRSRRYLCS